MEITKDLGPATAYAYAKAQGYTGTESEFATLMAAYATVGEATRQNRLNSEAWAVGTKDGTDVDTDADQYENNAKYWAEDAKDTAEMMDGVALDETAQEVKDIVFDHATLTERMFEQMIEQIPGDEVGQLIVQDLVDMNSLYSQLARELEERKEEGIL